MGSAGAFQNSLIMIVLTHSRGLGLAIAKLSIN